MAKKKKTSNELLPEAGTADVGRRVFDLLEQVVADKQNMGLEDKWFRFYEMGKNKHWRKHSKGLTLNSANLMSVHRRRSINTLTDNNPTFNVRRIIAKDDTDDKFKTVLRAIEYWWNETEQQDIFELSVYNGETYGACIEKSVFDLDKEYGIGEVDTLVVDPFYFGLYPVKCLDIQKAQAVFHYYPMSVREIKRQYGEAAAEVTSDADALANGYSEDRRMVSGVKETVERGGSATTSFGGVIKNLMSTLTGTNTSTYDGDEAVIVECWCKDYSLDKDGNAVYPGFIRVITAVNGYIVLSDKKNPSVNPNLPSELTMKTYLFDKFPFAKANSNKDPINFWGESDYEQLTGLQMEFNKSLSQFASLKDKVSGVKFINPKTSGVHNSEITSGVTVLNPFVPNHGMEWAAPPPIPRELLESMEMYKELFFAVAGTFDLEQANTPGKQVIAYKAIAALLERASTMMKGKIRNYSKLIRDRGRMAVSQMQNWYTEARFISFKEDGNEGTGEAFGPDMIVPMKLSVVSGSTMPRSEVQRREEALTLYDKQAIDNEELLKTLDWPKADEVVNRMQQGPIQGFLERMMVVGMPEEMTEYFGEIASMDDKEVERAVERNEIPFFNELFAFEGVQPDEKRQLDLDKLRAELAESNARTEKLRADIEQTLATADKEAASIEQTDERIRIDKGSAVSATRLKERELEIREKEIDAKAKEEKPKLKEVKSVAA